MVACIVSASDPKTVEGGRPPLGDRFQHHMLTSAVELLSHQLLTYNLRTQTYTKPHLMRSHLPPACLPWPNPKVFKGFP